MTNQQTHKSDEEIAKEFEQVFWDEIGTETAPDGTQNMYLIRDEDGEPVNGIDFEPEMKEIQKWVVSALQQSRQQERERVLEDLKGHLDEMVNAQQDPDYCNGIQAAIDIITNPSNTV